jgi:hypothetical protein
MLVVITGSRDFPIDKAPIIWEALRKMEKEHEDDWHWSPWELHHGECPFGGADLIGASWASGAGWKVVSHPPKERTGYYYNLRNQEMVDLNPDYVLACFLRGAKNQGTTNTVNMAKAAGLKDRIWTVEA